MKEEMKGIDHRPWVSDGDDAHTFGFDIHFGCCTANFNQGLPKYGIGERERNFRFIRSIVMKSTEGYVVPLYGDIL